MQLTCLSCSQWSSKGVETVVTGDGRGVHCKSDHLTSFAILLNIRGNIDTVVSLLILTTSGTSEQKDALKTAIFSLYSPLYIKKMLCLSSYIVSFAWKFTVIIVCTVT